MVIYIWVNSNSTEFHIFQKNRQEIVCEKQLVKKQSMKSHSILQ